MKNDTMNVIAAMGIHTGQVKGMASMMNPCGHMEKVSSLPIHTCQWEMV